MDNTTTNVQGWISVKDRLPEEEQTIIGFGNQGMLIGKIYAQNTSDAYDCISEHHELYEVTHWMPLPEPPTKGIIAEGLIDHGETKI